MFHILRRKLLLFISILLLTGPVFAFSLHSLYSLTLAILSYSKWSNNIAPTLCVFGHPSIATAFQKQIKESGYNYQIQKVTYSSFTKTQCQAVFFSGLSPQQQQVLINSYPQKNLLSFSDSNPECETGSIFCLYTQQEFTTFKVNLDALSFSQVHIDPRVLLLARNTE